LFETLEFANTKVQIKLFKDLPKTKNFHIYNNPSHNKCKLYLAKQIETLTAQISRILLRKQKFPFSFFCSRHSLLCLVGVFTFMGADKQALSRVKSFLVRLFGGCSGGKQYKDEV
jgi:hypothetical protein